MDLKLEAARGALKYVENGMTLGLGSGSTAGHFLELLGQAVTSGNLTGITGVPTSVKTAHRARELGIALTSLGECARLRRPPLLDLTVDGADEVDPELNLIKGLGMALLREKIVAINTHTLVIIVDQSKLVDRLGQGPLPVELARFGWEANVDWLTGLSDRAELWLQEDGTPYVTDNGNYLARCWFEKAISDPPELAGLMDKRPGILEHGLFLGLARRVVVATERGIEVMECEHEC
jgi:ribose 5-phosphate isomerase A